MKKGCLFWIYDIQSTTVSIDWLTSNDWLIDIHAIQTAVEASYGSSLPLSHLNPASVPPFTQRQEPSLTTTVKAIVVDQVPSRLGNEVKHSQENGILFQITYLKYRVFCYPCFWWEDIIPYGPRFWLLNENNSATSFLVFSPLVSWLCSNSLFWESLASQPEPFFILFFIFYKRCIHCHLEMFKK